MFNVEYLQAHCTNLDEKFSAFETARQEISLWMDGIESELQDVIKPTITERVAVADNSAPLIQVSPVQYCCTSHHSVCITKIFKL